MIARYVSIYLYHLYQTKGWKKKMTLLLNYFLQVTLEDAPSNSDCDVNLKQCTFAWKCCSDIIPQNKRRFLQAWPHHFLKETVSGHALKDFLCLCSCVTEEVQTVAPERWKTEIESISMPYTSDSASIRNGLKFGFWSSDKLREVPNEYAVGFSVITFFRR